MDASATYTVECGPRSARLPNAKRTFPVHEGGTGRKTVSGGIRQYKQDMTHGASVARGAESRRPRRPAQTDVFSNIGARAILVLRVNPSVTLPRSRARCLLFFFGDGHPREEQMTSSFLPEAPEPSLQWPISKSPSPWWLTVCLAGSGRPRCWRLVGMSSNGRVTSGWLETLSQDTPILVEAALAYGARGRDGLEEPP